MSKKCPSKKGVLLSDKERLFLQRELNPNIHKGYYVIKRRLEKNILEPLPVIFHNFMQDILLLQTRYMSDPKHSKTVERNNRLIGKTLTAFLKDPCCSVLDYIDLEELSKARYYSLKADLKIGEKLTQAELEKRIRLIKKLSSKRYRKAKKYLIDLFNRSLKEDPSFEHGVSITVPDTISKKSVRAMLERDFGLIFTFKDKRVKMEKLTPLGRFVASVLASLKIKE